jgi:RNA polymerase sigma factor (sigma-70 family)
MRHLSEAQRSDELQRLIDEQTEDLKSNILFPETITPLRPRVLECLSNKEKAAIILSVIGSMSNVEIGEAMGTNESTIRGWIKRAYEKLRS